jgi:ribosomal protein L24
LAFTQDPFRLIKEAVKPWDTKGRVIPGDFIRVLQGDLTGKEGFVKDFNDSQELVVEETSKDPSQPLVISQGWYAKAQEKVRGYVYRFRPYTHFKQASFTVAAKMTFCYDRLQPYDVIKVTHGSATGRRGHVLDIRHDGYLTIRATGSVGTDCFDWSFQGLLYLFNRTPS